jgi:signal peptidase I
MWLIGTRDDGPRPIWRTTRVRFAEVAGFVFLSSSVFVLARFVVPFRVRGWSMEPALHDGDYLVADRFTYRWLHPPRRGDIVVITDPHLVDRALVKRVVGLPGETLHIDDGHVYADAQRLREAYEADRSGPTWGPNTIPADHYLVLGDNRTCSRDSLVWGALPSRNIIGRVYRWPAVWQGSSFCDRPRTPSIRSVRTRLQPNLCTPWLAVR